MLVPLRLKPTESVRLAAPPRSIETFEFACEFPPPPTYTPMSVLKRPPSVPVDKPMFDAWRSISVSSA